MACDWSYHHHPCLRDGSFDTSPLSRIVDIIIQLGEALLRIKETTGCSRGVSSADIVVRTRKGPAKFKGRDAQELRFKYPFNTTFEP
jgi:hypothetical protein